MLTNLYFREISEALNTSLTLISVHYYNIMTKLQLIDRKEIKDLLLMKELYILKKLLMGMQKKIITLEKLYIFWYNINVDIMKVRYYEK